VLSNLVDYKTLHILEYILLLEALILVPKMKRSNVKYYHTVFSKYHMQIS